MTYTRLSASTWILVLVVGAFLLAPLADADARRARKKQRRAPSTFVAEGTIAIGNPFSLQGFGITEGEFTSSGCRSEPATQGVDGFVVPVPKVYARVGSIVEVGGEDTTGLFDADMRFYDARCRFRGAADGGDLKEIVELPAGTRFVVVNLWMGYSSQFRLEVEPILRR